MMYKGKVIISILNIRHLQYLHLIPVFSLQNNHFEFSTGTQTQWLLTTENPDLNVGFKDFMIKKHKSDKDFI